MKRRDFIKYAMGGMAGLWVGANLPPWVAKTAYAQAAGLNFTITDAMKDMATHQINPDPKKSNIAQCYFWLFKEASVLLPEVPGPIIFTLEGESIPLSVTNGLTQDHAFSIPAIGFSTGIIPPGATVNTVINLAALPLAKAGSYLYYDDLNAPVNRMMGLHGAFIIMPTQPSPYPYSAADMAANPLLKQLFDDLGNPGGTSPWWPGLGWGQGAANPQDPDRELIPDTPPFRRYIWLLHQASPNLFADVGLWPGDYDAGAFVDQFLNDSVVVFKPNKKPLGQGSGPQYFTINGQSGHFSHNSPFICPNLRVGEPCIISVLNAGMWTHSMHIHANHVYVLAVDNGFNQFPDINAGVVPDVQDNHIWIDTYTAAPLRTYDWLVPYMKPPDVPNTTGNGRADLHQPLTVIGTPVPTYGVIRNAVGEPIGSGPTPPGVTTWPPIQELNMAIPKFGTKGVNNIPLHVPLAPLCFPMHDHSEPSQTSQGGNYNTGLIAGMNFSGDRTLDVPFQTFFNLPIEYGPDFNESPQEGAGPLPPFEEIM